MNAIVKETILFIGKKMNLPFMGSLLSASHAQPITLQLKEEGEKILVKDVAQN